MRGGWRVEAGPRNIYKYIFTKKDNVYINL